MSSVWSNWLIYVIGVVAITYQFIVSPLLWTTLGIARSYQSLSDFNVTCERIDQLGLEGCEDMWFHEKSGLLYMSCGSTSSRTGWLPSVDALNVSARTGKDRIAILDTRSTGPISSRLRWTSTIGYVASDGGKSLDLHGFDVHVGPGDEPMLKLLLINHRPPIDPTSSRVVPAEKIGANSTIEVFSAKLGDTVLRHVKTYHDPTIQTPNRVAWVTNFDFVFSNDKSGKVGFRRSLDPVIGGGSVGYCNKTDCAMASTSGLNFPNGLVRGRDGYIYVPSTTTGKIRVMEVQANQKLQTVSTITLPYPIDNLSVDSKGDMYAATFPQAYKFMKHQKHPYDIYTPTAVWKITKVSEEPREYTTNKVLEGQGESLPGATIAIHDAKTKRLFLGSMQQWPRPLFPEKLYQTDMTQGAVSGYISICDIGQ